jgi:hypothetical protein
MKLIHKSPTTKKVLVVEVDITPSELERFNNGEKLQSSFLKTPSQKHLLLAAIALMS